MPYATRDGLSLYYEQSGRGEPPLVFIHGWCCNHAFFQPQFDHFQASHHVAALDLRGCGNSTQTADGYDIPTIADDIEWFCRELGLSRPVIAGHSWGGMIAIELGARYPDLPAAVIAVDPGPIDRTEEVRQAHQELESGLAGPDCQTVREDFVKRGFQPGDDPERRLAIIATMCAVPPQIAEAVIRGSLEWDGVEALKACKPPVLVLLAQTGGSNDPARLRAHRPDLQFGVTVGTGHFNQLEAPEQVNPMIERFLRVTLSDDMV